MKISRLLFSFTCLLVVSGAGYTSMIWLQLPNAEEARAIGRSTHIRVQKPDSPENRVELLEIQTISYVSAPNIPDELIQTVVASEDRRFYKRSWHYMIAKTSQAAMVCAVKKLIGKGSCKGNSTITQQLVKQLLGTRHRSAYRKVVELIGAIKLELLLTKTEIIELYLNRIYLGNGNYGIGLASRYYFSKIPKDLTLEESALLAGTIQKPRYDPIDEPANNRARANLILSLMHKQGFIDNPVTIKPGYKIRRGKRYTTKAYAMHQWFWMKDEVAQMLKGKDFGEYKVWTTQDPELQIYAYSRLKRMVSSIEKLQQGSVVVMRPGGEVLAMVGGAGLDVVARGRNRATRNKGLYCPPAASTMKLVTYLMAIENKLKEHSEISAFPFSQGSYTVSNQDGKEFGYVSVGVSFAKSINTAAVRLLKTYGYRDWRSVARRLGLPVQYIRNELGVAIGQSEMCLIELTNAYAVIPNGGNLSRPTSVTGIANYSGTITWNSKPLFDRKEFSQQNVKVMDRMLRQVVVEGTGSQAEHGIEGLRLRGKTGTADHSHSATFIGFTKALNRQDLVIGVWLGNDIPTPIPGLAGANAPTEVFRNLLSDIVSHTDYFN